MAVENVLAARVEGDESDGNSLAPTRKAIKMTPQSRPFQTRSKRVRKIDMETWCREKGFSKRVGSDAFDLSGTNLTRVPTGMIGAISNERCKVCTVIAGGFRETHGGM